MFSQLPNAGLLLPTLACCWLAANALHVGRDEPPFVQQRLDELNARQDAAIYEADFSASLHARQDGSPLARLAKPRILNTFWGCDQKQFRMAMPAHSATCTVTQALVLTLKESGIACTRNGVPDNKKAGQNHDHNALAQNYIDQGSWSSFNSTVSFVFAKDPWSRLVSATHWLGGFNVASPPHEQIRDFRKFVKRELLVEECYKPHPVLHPDIQECTPMVPSGNTLFKYLHSFSEFAYAVPPGKSEEEQVVTYVGRVKDLSRSFKHVCSLLGVEKKHCVDPNDSRVSQHWITRSDLAPKTPDIKQQDWQQANRSRVSTVELFDDELRERVARIWAKDIERFGFVFGEA